MRSRSCGYWAPMNTIERRARPNRGAEGPLCAGELRRSDSLVRAAFAHEFMSRARRYDACDRTLASVTRFFAAAALINAALGDCLRICPMAGIISIGVADLLLDISRGLEHFNASLTQKASVTSTRGRALDRA